MTAATNWVDLFEMPNLRGRARRVFGPSSGIPILSTVGMAGTRVESIAAGPGTYARLYNSTQPTETICWLRPNSIVGSLSAIAGGHEIDAIDILDKPPVAGAPGYELFAAHFSAPQNDH